MALDPSRTGQRIAANDASYDDDPTAELEAPVTCELDEPEAAGAGAATARAAEGTADSAASRAAARPWPPVTEGSVLRGRYRLEAVIGTGGFSTVYRARDLNRDAAGPGGDLVAIKVLREDYADSPAALARLKREFGQLRLLSHPGIVRVFDLDCEDGTWFEVMELLEGESLSSLLRARARRIAPAAEAMALLRGFAEALEHVHGHGLVHGDLKPANLFVRGTGEPCLLDFGAVSPECPGAAGTAEVGTARYASPEILERRPPAPADDVYSLACVACELLTGEHAVGAAEHAHSVTEAERSGLTPAQAAALARGLAPRRSDRPASPRAFIAELAAAAEAAAAIPDGPAAPLDPPELPAYQAEPAETVVAPRMSSRRRLAWLVVVILLAATAIALFGMDGGQPSSGTTPRPATADGPPAVFATPATPAAPMTAAPAEASRADAPAPGPSAPAGPLLPVRSDPAVPASTVSFQSGSVAVSRLAASAAVALRREGSADGRAVVAWNIAEDSALADRDFAGPLSGTEIFAEGQRSRTLFIPLAGDPAIAADRAFVVSLAPGETRTGIGEPASVRVVIRTPAALAAGAATDR